MELHELLHDREPEPEPSMTARGAMPFEILPLQNSTKKDRSLFSLAPVNCILDSYDPNSRGKAKALTNGSYRIIGLGGGDGGVLIHVKGSYGVYQVGWERVSTAPTC